MNILDLMNDPKACGQTDIVYVVMLGAGGDGDEKTIGGIYATEERAKAAIRDEFSGYGKGRTKIEEWEVE